ncbi:MAG: hypothetical protein JWO32_642 [Bacteroidetes bacterium]|nr:hypothetical protein [Bacteroidota bacterium]
MKVLLPLLFCVHMMAQTSNFNLSYNYAGIGTNLGKKTYPVIEVKNNTIKCIIESDTAYSKPDWTSKPKEISVKFRQSSIDSINHLLKPVKDTLISEYNPCIQNGGIHFMRIASGHKTLSFELTNTYHLTALKITNILNTYMPKGHGVWASEKDVKETFDCWTNLRGKWVRQKPDTTQHKVKKPEEKK